MRKRIIAVALGPAALCSCTTLPSNPEVPAYVDTAEVILAQPLYKPVQVTRPVNECWTEHVRRADPAGNAFAGPVAGGVIGGLIGHSLSRGQGKTPMTVAGALVGASIGHNLSRSTYRAPATAAVKRCTTVNRFEQRQLLVGYRVDYRYEGQTFTTRTREHPGRFIRVRVNVDPVDGT